MVAPPSDPIEVFLITPPVLRWGLAAFGSVIAIIAIAELWRAVWPISIVTPFFGLILVVAVAVSTRLLVGALFGPDEVWRIEPGRLTIRRSLRRFHDQRHYGPTDIGAITLETSEWDSRPASYFLVIHLVSSRQLKSPEFGTQQKAAAAMAMLAPSAP